MKAAVKNLENKKVGDIDLSDAVFGVPVRQDILHQVVGWQLNKRRSGNHKVKDVSEVSGTGKKPWKQKGTGSARAGNLRATQHRGGQVVHGPVVRSHATDLPKKIRILGLKSALSAKQAEGKLVVLDAAKSATPKTRELVKSLKGLGLTSVLVIDDAIDENFALAAGNIPHVDVLPQQGANVYDILRHDTLVLTKAAVEKLEERLK